MNNRSVTRGLRKYNTKVMNYLNKHQGNYKYLSGCLLIDPYFITIRMNNNNNNNNILYSYDHGISLIMKELIEGKLF